MNAFIKLWQADRRTVLFVTHEVDEALLLADEIYQLEGRPVRIDRHVQIDTAKKNKRSTNGNHYKIIVINYLSSYRIYHVIATFF